MRSEYRKYVDVYCVDIVKDGKEIELDYCEPNDVDSLVSEIEEDVNKILKKIEEFEVKEAKEMLEELADKLY